MEDIDISKNIVSFGINKALFSIENLESGFLTRICRNNFSKEQLLQFQYELRHITNEMANQMVQAHHTPRATTSTAPKHYYPSKSPKKMTI